MIYDDADMTTNSSESVNSGLNKHCPPIRSENGLQMKILRHARKHFKNYLDKVKNDNLTQNKRRKITTERFDNLKDICDEYDNLSGPERQERLIEFLGLLNKLYSHVEMLFAIINLNSQLILTQNHLPLIMKMNKTCS